MVPTFVIVTLAENRFTRPILEDELRQVGITAAKSLASEIVTSRWLSLPNPTLTIERHIQEIIYTQPNILRIDVLVRDPAGEVKIIASNVEEDPLTPPPGPNALTDVLISEYRIDQDENNLGQWDIRAPIEHKVGKDSKSPRKILGTVHVVISLKLVGRIVGAISRATAIAAALALVTLVILLSYFLRKTIDNDRRLRQAESQNLQLTEQLHEAERNLMNSEKLAAMGQLTASFAHEIGSPLNAISGHLQLLTEEAGALGSAPARLEVISGQVAKIEEIVKGFLQSTSEPPSHRQLEDVNRLVDKTLGIVLPRVEAIGVEVRKDLDRKMGPLRVVPLDLEQILLNTVNNSLDSLKAKRLARATGGRTRLLLEVSSRAVALEGKDWAEFAVYDTGGGIRKADLDQVLKPFFTTKAPGEGTGLGLAICSQLLRKYGGKLDIDSKEGAWTRVTIRLPYHELA